MEERIQEAESTLAAHRQANQEKYEALQRQKEAYEAAKANTDNVAEQDQYEQAIQSMKSLMLVYQVSQGNHAEQINAPGTINNQYIFDNLRNLGLGRDSDEYEQLHELAKRQQEKQALEQQKTLKEIAEEGSIEKELPRLSRTEENRVRNFLRDPDGVAVPTNATLYRKAPRLMEALKALHALPQNNAWKGEMCRSILQTLDEKVLSGSRESVKEILDEMEKTNARTARAIRRNPRLLYDYAGTVGMTQPQRPRPSENFSSWIGRLNSADLENTRDILERVKGFDINRAGDLEDALEPIKNEIIGASGFGALPASLQNLLNSDPKSVLSKAAEKFLKKEGKTFDLPDPTGSTFPQIVQEMTNKEELSEIRQIIMNMQDGNAYEKNGEIQFKSKDIEQINKHLQEIKNEEVRNFIKSNPSALLMVEPGLSDPAGMAPPSTNFDNYKDRLNPDQRELLADTLLRVETPASNPFVLNAAGNALERQRDQLIPIKNEIAGRNGYGALDADLQALLDSEASTVLSKAAEEFLNLRGKSYDLPNPIGRNFVDVINDMTDKKDLAEIRQMILRMRAGDAYAKNNEIRFTAQDIEKIDKNLEKINDDELKAYILSHPEALRTLNASLPDPATLRRRTVNFDQYKKNITHDDREILADALLKVNDPSDGFVINQTGDGLERKNLKQARDIFINLHTSIDDGGEAQNRLNSGNPDEVKDLLESATEMAFGSRRAVNVPSGNNFIERLNNASPEQLKSIAHILETVRKRCKFDNTNNVFRSRR